MLRKACIFADITAALVTTMPDQLDECPQVRNEKGRGARAGQSAVWWPRSPAGEQADAFSLGHDGTTMEAFQTDAG